MESSSKRALRELLKTGEVETKVVCARSLVSAFGERFGEYGKFAATPQFEQRNGMDVFHPRYFLPPKIGMNIAPYALARGALPTIRKLIREGFEFDLIDAHYYYPDGVAAGFIARRWGSLSSSPPAEPISISSQSILFPAA